LEHEEGCMTIYSTGPTTVNAYCSIAYVREQGREDMVLPGRSTATAIEL